MQQQLQVHTRIAQLRLMLQLDQRRLTATEEQYLTSWIQMGFSDEVIGMAYERTCLNTGGLKWNYMNSILKSWHEKNLHTPKELAEGDQRNTNQMYQRHNDTLSPMEQKAIAQALADGQE